MFEIIGIIFVITMICNILFTPLLVIIYRGEIEDWFNFEDGMIAVYLMFSIIYIPTFIIIIILDAIKKVKERKD